MSHPLVVIIAATIAISIAPNSDCFKKSGLKDALNIGLKNLSQALFRHEKADNIITIHDRIYITTNQDLKERGMTILNITLGTYCVGLSLFMIVRDIFSMSGSFPAVNVVTSTTLLFLWEQESYLILKWSGALMYNQQLRPLSGR